MAGVQASAMETMKTSGINLKDPMAGVRLYNQVLMEGLMKVKAMYPEANFDIEALKREMMVEASSGGAPNPAGASDEFSILR
jgi:hypothetical protein